MAAPIAEGLRDAGLRVWYDDFSLKVGDNLRRAIELGLSRSRRGVVIVSPAFLRKAWPQRELDSFIVRESAEEPIILPVWHGVAAEELNRQSPLLASRVATMTSRGLDVVVQDLLRSLCHCPPPRLANRKPRTARIQFEVSRLVTMKLESSGSMLLDDALADWELSEPDLFSALTAQERSELQEVLDVLRLALLTVMPMALAQAAVFAVLAEAVRTLAPRHLEELGLDTLGVEKLCREIYEHDLELFKRSRSDPSAVLVWDLLATLFASYVGAAIRDPACLPDELPTAAQHYIEIIAQRASKWLASVEGPFSEVWPCLPSLLEKWREAGRPAVFTSALEALLGATPL